MQITIAGEATPALADAFARLIPQLSQSNAPPTLGQLREIVDAPATDVFVAVDASGAIVGAATLAVFRIPTAVRAWIEDVVVDEAARGQGVGAALTEAMIARARERGAKTVELTSRSSRGAANRLYTRLGFMARDTNVYRYDLDA
jgi:ribosomal protein S18 acetylase RimI-like enzyme